MSTATNFPPSPALPRAQAETLEFQERVGTISRHSAVFLAGTLFSSAAGYFFKIYVAREIGAEALGVYALGMSIVGVVGVFNAAGLPTTAARFVAEYSSRHDNARLGAFLRGGLSLLGIGNLFLAGAVVLFAPWIAKAFYHAPALAAYSWSFAAIMLLGVLNLFLGQCLAGFREVARRAMISQVLGTSVTIVVAVVLIAYHFGLTGYLAAQVAAAAVVLIFMARSVWKLTPPAARSSGGWGHLERNVVAFSATSFGLGLVHFALGQADKITLGYFLDVRQVGIYAVATAMVGVVPIALTAVNQIFSPTIAELHSVGNRDLLQRLYTSLTKWVLMATLPLILTVSLFSSGLMKVFGHGFEGGAIVLTVGALSQLFNCGVGSVGFLLLMSGHQVVLVRIQAVNAVVMVTLNLLLVPRFGILGAALSSSLAVAGTNLWGLAEVRRLLGLYPYDRSYVNLFMPSVLTSVFLCLIRDLWSDVSWRVAGAALVAAYIVFFAMVWFRGLDGDDRVFAHMIWRKLQPNERAGRIQ